MCKYTICLIVFCPRSRCHIDEINVSEKSIEYRTEIMHPQNAEIKSLFCCIGIWNQPVSVQNYEKLYFLCLGHFRVLENDGTKPINHIILNISDISFWEDIFFKNNWFLMSETQSAWNLENNVLYKQVNVTLCRNEKALNCSLISEYDMKNYTVQVTINMPRVTHIALMFCATNMYT